MAIYFFPNPAPCRGDTDTDTTRVITTRVSRLCFCRCSALDALVGLTKDIVNPSTGKPFVFVCLPCSQAYLYPTKAVSSYLESFCAHPEDSRVRSIAATLRTSGNISHRYIRSTGVVVGTYVGCRPRQPRAPLWGPSITGQCVSILHPVGLASGARYKPGPSALPFRWGLEEASAELATPFSKRRNVCGGCRSSAERQSRLQRVAASDPAGGATAASASAEPDKVLDLAGLQLLSFAASAQVPLLQPPTNTPPTSPVRQPLLTPPGGNRAHAPKTRGTILGVTLEPANASEASQSRLRLSPVSPRHFHGLVIAQRWTSPPPFPPPCRQLTQNCAGRRVLRPTPRQSLCPATSGSSWLPSRLVSHRLTLVGPLSG